MANNEVRGRILKGVDFKGLPVSTGGRLNINNMLLLPPPQVTIDVTPNGPTTVSRGGIISYNVTVHNTAATTATVNASVVAVFPNGSETPLASRTLTVGAGGTVSQSFSKTVPSGAALGEYQITGRAEIPSASYDESIVTYTVIP